MLRALDPHPRTNAGGSDQFTLCATETCDRFGGKRKKIPIANGPINAMRTINQQPVARTARQSKAQ
jgi:hypothetical protein